MTSLEAARAPPTRGTPAREVLKCTRCGTTDTPQWRNRGPNLMCNRCGIKEQRASEKRKVQEGAGSHGGSEQEPYSCPAAAKQAKCLGVGQAPRRIPTSGPPAAPVPPARGSAASSRGPMPLALLSPEAQGLAPPAAAQPGLIGLLSRHRAGHPSPLAASPSIAGPLDCTVRLAAEADGVVAAQPPAGVAGASIDVLPQHVPCPARPTYQLAAPGDAPPGGLPSIEDLLSLAADLQGLDPLSFGLGSPDPSFGSLLTPNKQVPSSKEEEGGRGPALPSHSHQGEAAHSLEDLLAGVWGLAGRVGGVGDGVVPLRAPPVQRQLAAVQHSLAYAEAHGKGQVREEEVSSSRPSSHGLARTAAEGRQLRRSPGPQPMADPPRSLLTGQIGTAQGMHSNVLPPPGRCEGRVVQREVGRMQPVPTPPAQQPEPVAPTAQEPAEAVEPGRTPALRAFISHQPQQLQSQLQPAPPPPPPQQQQQQHRLQQPRLAPPQPKAAATQHSALVQHPGLARTASDGLSPACALVPASLQRSASLGASRPSSFPAAVRLPSDPLPGRVIKTLAMLPDCHLQCLVCPGPLGVVVAEHLCSELTVAVQLVELGDSPGCPELMPAAVGRGGLAGSCSPAGLRGAGCCAPAAPGLQQCGEGGEGDPPQATARISVINERSGVVLTYRDGLLAEDAQVLPSIVRGCVVWDSGEGWRLLFDQSAQVSLFCTALRQAAGLAAGQRS